jgi:hypothetical protein
VLDVRARSGDDGLVLRLFLGQFVEVRVGFGVGRVDLIELLLGGDDFTQRGLDFLAHRVVGVQLWFLGQVADGNAGEPLHFSVVLLVLAGHDLQHGRLAGAVQAEQADLGSREEGKGDVLDDLALGRNDLVHAQHRHYILGHGAGT